MNWFYNPFATYLYFWGWQDCIEALFLIIVLYKITAWLNKDRTRKMVLYLYSYCTALLIAYYAHLPLIFSFLINTAPAAAIVLILMHQEILQKRFAMPSKILPAQLSTQWIDELLQASLVAMNSKKAISCIIEHQDTLQPLISTPYNLNMPCQKSVLLLLSESSLFEHSALIWLSHDGIIKGINSSFKDLQADSEKDTWKMAALICTKTDALAFRANPEHNTFDIVLQGNIIENLSSTYCRTVLIQYINKSHIDFKNNSSLAKKKELFNENNHA
jgi:uncharacterized membrane protein